MKIIRTHSSFFTRSWCQGQYRCNTAICYRTCSTYGDVGILHGSFSGSLEVLPPTENCRALLSILVGGILPEVLWAVLSLLWRYPIPGNGLVKLTFTLGCIIFLSRYLPTNESRGLNRQRARIITIVMTGYLLIVLFYFLLALAFARSPWAIQLGLVVIQPPLRSLIKRQSWVYARKLNDLSTDVTLNIVDMSASMYQALCVQYSSRSELVALIVFEDFVLGVAVAHMYATHIFIVDGYRTLQTVIKIVEGNLSSTLVVEENETQTKENTHSGETLSCSTAKQEGVTSTEVEAVQTPKSAQGLHRTSSDSIKANFQRSSRNLNNTTVTQEVGRVVSVPVTEKNKLQRLRRHSTASNVTPYSGNSQFLPKPSQNFAARVSAKSTQPHEPPLSSKNVQVLRRTASDTIAESKFEREQPMRKSVHGDAIRDTSIKDSSTSEPRLQIWARDPSKVYCFVDIRPEAAPPPPSPKQKRPSQGRHNSMNLPPLGDLLSPEGFGRRPPVRRSTSVFLTPRTLTKSGSKRLLGLGRSTAEILETLTPLLEILRRRQV